jgi:3-hydroxybutyryl-CoA dehydrogenase
MIWHCDSCGRDWRYPVETCIYCKKPLRALKEGEYTVRGRTEVSISTPDHRDVPYWTLMLEDDLGNLHIRKTFHPHNIGDVLGTTADETPRLKVGIIGTGIMGSGITEAAVRAGLTVTLKSRTQTSLDKAMARVEKGLSKSIGEKELETTLNKITPTTDYADLLGQDIVIECIDEDIEKKRVVLRELKKLGADMIVATNTSSLSINELAEFAPDPAKFIGLHFFNPVTRMNLVEVILGKQTSNQTIDTIREFVEQIKKIPVAMNDQPGFIVNRLLFALIHEAVSLLEAGGSSAEDIDQAMMLGANFPIGPLALADLIGLDICLKIMENLRDSFGEKYAPPASLVAAVAAGNLGKKTGTGFYDYA